ncbi:Dps family protein [Laceyella putida]|uniref:Dps family protein n=1 Tax=Laceyella putida TaxID=110101 RepID=A0ABW2RM11_9BACL
MTTQAVYDVLNKQVANWSVLYVKLHNYHWFVKGENFFELHEKFEEFYTEASGYIDELAERLLAIGGKPAATMKEYLSLASIQEASGSETTQHMVNNLIADFKTLVNELKQGIDTAEQADDESTADMLTHIRTSLEKHLWMLNAFTE